MRAYWEAVRNLARDRFEPVLRYELLDIATVETLVAPSEAMVEAERIVEQLT
jgi:hypothetical protein